MAVTGQRSHGDLKQLVLELNLKCPLPKGSRSEPTKDQLIRVLQDYYILQKGGSTRSLSLMLEMDNPMLASQFKDLKENEQKTIWDNKTWYAEEKLDGVRMLTFYLEGEQKPHYYSRNISVKDFLPVDYSGNVLSKNFDKSKLTDEFVLDTELISLNPKVSTILEKKAGGVVTETMLQAVTALLALNPEASLVIQQEAPLQFQAFDCLYWNGEWLLNKPLHERRRYLIQAIKQLQDAGADVQLPKASREKKKQFTDAIIKAGGEGVILKDLLAPYSATSSRAHRKWVKFKRTASSSSALAGFSDTIDAYISGFEPADEKKGLAGLVGSLELSLTLVSKDGFEKDHHIARVSNIPLDLRKAMTELVDGKPTLKQEYYGQVVEVDGQDISARALRFSHSRLIKFRPDRSAHDCKMDEDFLKSLVL